MSQSFVGEVRLVGFNFAPVDWAFCAGQQVSISEYTPLFDLIGTTYGGDIGKGYFNLPDLRGRIPIHQGSGGGSSYYVGQTGGLEMVGINLSQYPSHNHLLLGSSNGGSTSNPSNGAVGSSKVYSSETPTTPMLENMLAYSGGDSQPHENRQPYQVLNWIISLFGLFPPPE